MPDRPPKLWKLARAAGDPVQLPITADAFWDLALSPDESELPFRAGNPDACRQGLSTHPGSTSCPCIHLNPFGNAEPGTPQVAG